MPYININNNSLYYEEEGNGPETIVFAHSLLFNLRMFDEQVKYLKKDYRCIRFDFPGQGKSAGKNKAYDLNSLTEETAEFVKAVGCKSFHFAGFSMGGMVGLRMALKYPEIIKSLILIDTSSEAEPVGNISRNRLMVWTAKHVGLKVLASRIMKMFFGPEFLRDPEKKDLRKTWRAHFLANKPGNITRAAKGVLSRKSITSKLDKINQPCLILVGQHDRLTDLEKAEIMHDHLKNSTLIIVPRAAHMSTVEEPDIVNTLIRDFLKD